MEDLDGNEPAAVGPVVNKRKLLELLELQAEGPTVDYKELYDLRRDSALKKRHQVELAKHVGAMSMRGGYLVVGVDDQAVPTGALSAEQAAFLDEARLRPMLLTWLPESLEIWSQRHEVDGKTVVLIYVAPNPAGFAMFKADGQYGDGKKTTTVFSEGDIFFRDGTQSRKVTGRGLELIIARAPGLARRHRCRRYVAFCPTRRESIATYRGQRCRRTTSVSRQGSRSRHTCRGATTQFLEVSLMMQPSKALDW